MASLRRRNDDDESYSNGSFCTILQPLSWGFGVDAASNVY
jgi:hypothetical protein